MIDYRPDKPVRLMVVRCPETCLVVVERDTIMMDPPDYWTRIPPADDMFLVQCQEPMGHKKAAGISGFHGVDGHHSYWWGRP